MKQKDIALIVVAIILSAALSLVISKYIFAPPKNRQQQVEVVQPITSNFPQPDNRYYNSNAFDPTKLITINPNDNSDPFKANQ